ncbi:hypothetical protein [Novosphingobium sp. B1]|uniref:hypothetical protein n=1 Tax=Novosphingobium sp. B1 TaxID=1938756 RepID=UPI0009D8EF85|nr:hypothetical protein [Novosphingobium sp. B1]SMD03779.1 hypothetical protein SAMN06272759_1258 [Novosphingobium sp. B1]
MTNPERQKVEQIVKGLGALEIERLVGWQGPAGAAYNCISEDLCEMGLLNSDWSISPLGLAVRSLIQENGK